MICKLCQKSDDFGKSHVIPEAFFKMVRDPKIATKVITNMRGAFPKKAPIGVYDEKLLCKECERKFSSCDSYAIKLIRDEICISKCSEIQLGGVVSFYDFDYSKFKRFTNALLWRASASDHQFYKHVKLGPVENSLHRLVLDEDPGNEHQFSVVCFQYDADPELIPIISPFKNRFDGVSTYDFVFAGLRLCIKASFRAFPKEIQKLCAMPGSKLPIIRTSYDHSNYKKMAKSIVDLQTHKVY